MSYMFREASAFNGDISSWNTAAVTNMYGTFNKATSFNGDISSWNTAAVTDMSYMFQNATAFNQDINKKEVTVDGLTYTAWNTAAATNMYAMFYNATSFNQDLSSWCITNIKTEPDFFSKYSALTDANKPQWGTCPVG